MRKHNCRKCKYYKKEGVEKCTDGVTKEYVVEEYCTHITNKMYTCDISSGQLFEKYRDTISELNTKENPCDKYERKENSIIKKIKEKLFN